MTTFLKRIVKKLFGSKAPPVNHPFFGEIILEEGKKGPYWLKEAYEDGELTVSIDTIGENAPSEKQIEFFRKISKDWDTIFAIVSNQFLPRYESMLGKPFPKKWSDEFRPVGLSIPLEGDKNKPWDVTFECLTHNSGFLLLAISKMESLLELLLIRNQSPNNRSGESDQNYLLPKIRQQIAPVRYL